MSKYFYPKDLPSYIQKSKKFLLLDSQAKYKRDNIPIFSGNVENIEDFSKMIETILYWFKDENPKLYMKYIPLSFYIFFSENKNQKILAKYFKDKLKHKYVPWLKYDINNITGVLLDSLSECKHRMAIVYGIDDYFIYLYENNLIENIETTYTTLCEYSTELAKFILSKERYNQNFSLIAFNSAIYAQNIVIAELLYNYNDTIILQKNKEIFLENIFYKRIEMVKFIYRLSLTKGEKIDIHHKDEKAFLISCINGDLDIAQWLYKTALEEGQKINITKTIIEKSTLNIKNWIETL